MDSRGSTAPPHRNYFNNYRPYLLFLSLFSLLLLCSLPFSALAGGIWGMGSYTDCQLGIFPQDEFTSPQKIVTINGLKVSAGYYFSAFIKSDGSLWTVGDNPDGCSGTGNIDSQDTPYQVETFGVTTLETGDYHTLYVKSGALKAMGDNGYGQLGDGTTEDRYAPVLIAGARPSHISGGNYHSLFVGTYSLVSGRDVNGDGAINLSDAVLALQILSYGSVANIETEADINRDGRIGLAEAIFVLQKRSGLR